MAETGKDGKPRLDPTGMGLGIAIGVALGAALDEFAIGIALGVAFGAALSLAMGRRKTKSNSTDSDEKDTSE